MKLLLLCIFATLAAGFVWNAARPETSPAPGLFIAADWKAFAPDTAAFDQDSALAALRNRIEGREEEPAGEVFEEIRMFKQMPAGRLLRVMELGFSRSLGVTCTHCHNPRKWSSEEKPQKQVAREMMQMVGTINRELLAGIDHLESERPTVNCTTCHRGQVKPALNLEN